MGKDAEFDLPGAKAKAADALRLCLAGDESAGLALYRGCVLPELAAELGLVLHARMIEAAGHGGTAEELRRMLFLKGNDISLASASPDPSPEAAVAEYEGFFARGIGNAVMVGGYIRALGLLGRTERVAEIFDAERLIHQVRIGDPEAVARAVLEAEAGYKKGTMTVTHNTSYLTRFERQGNAVYDALTARCRAEIAGYFARWAASDHPLAHLVPKDFVLSSWAMIARADGHNVRHVHPYGWATSVYYPVGLPEGSVGGKLHIGGWQDPPPPGWPDAAITPEPGLLVVLPSWVVHWTEPTGVEGTRIAIATDVVAKA